MEIFLAADRNGLPHLAKKPHRLRILGITPTLAHPLALAFECLGLPLASAVVQVGLEHSVQRSLLRASRFLARQ
jgi:hypothetical protein